LGAGGWVGRWAGGNAVCSSYFVVVAVAVVCGRAWKLACMFVRTLLAASDVWGRVVIRDACGGGGGACLFVVLFVVMELFIAVLAACLCGWLICSARHGTADNGDGHGDDATHLCVLAACVGRLWWTSAWARADRAFVFRSCRLVGGCLGVGRVAWSVVLVASAWVASAFLRDGRARVGGWVGRWVGRWQCSVQ
jgi:hypothetical protein